MLAQQVAKESVAYKERKVERKVSLESRDASGLPLGENCIERCFAESEMYCRDRWLKGCALGHHCNEEQRHYAAQDSKLDDT